MVRPLDGERLEYRWPLLCWLLACACRRNSPPPNPGDFAAELLAEVDGCLMQGEVRGRGPKLKRVPAAAAAMARVTAERHIHRERAPRPRAALGQRTTSIPLRCRAPHRHEPEQAQDLLHRHFAAQSVEVDTWHGVPRSARSRGDAHDRSIPFLSLGGTGTPLVRSGVVDALPARRRVAEPAGTLQRFQRCAQALVLDRQ